LLLLPGMWALGLWKNMTNDVVVRGYPEYKSYTSGISVVVLILLDLLLIPRWGLIGAAVASTLAYMTAAGTALCLYCRVSGFRPRDILLPKVEDLILVSQKIMDGMGQFALHKSAK
jgi:O-antigen/teichoic acid export membrane protein